MEGRRVPPSLARAHRRLQGYKKHHPHAKVIFDNLKMQGRVVNRILGLSSHLRHSMLKSSSAAAAAAATTNATITAAPKRALTTATADPREIIVFTDPGTKTVEFNRPKALNALNHNMVSTLLPQLKSWADNPEVHAVVMHGAGDRAFCAGGDVVQLWKDGQEDETRQR